MEAALRIGPVAQAAGVNIQTLRSDERRRLLRPPQRDPNGYRYYDRESVRLVRFTKRTRIGRRIGCGVLCPRDAPGEAPVWPARRD